MVGVKANCCNSYLIAVEAIIQLILADHPIRMLGDQ